MLKCSITQAKSLSFITWYVAESLFSVTLPTPKKRWIKYKISISLECKWIEKTNLTLQPKVCLGFLLMVREKQDSPSQKPVTKFGFKPLELVVYFVIHLNNFNKKLF